MKLRQKIDDFFDDTKEIVEEHKTKLKIYTVCAVSVSTVIAVIYNKGRKDAVASIQRKLMIENPELLVEMYKSFLL